MTRKLSALQDSKEGGHTPFSFPSNNEITMYKAIPTSYNALEGRYVLKRKCERSYFSVGNVI